ncbi:MAG: hypothetical protein V4642_13995 [Bacteroidota bacterium]
MEAFKNYPYASRSDGLLHTLTLLILVLSLIASGTGLFYSTDGVPYDFKNQYGDIVRIYGSGLYANDSFFRAPIFRGTDFTVFFIACPLLFVALLLDVFKNTLKTRLLLTSLIGCVLYYATSITFGVMYNFLHLLYIALFSLSFYGFTAAITSIDDAFLKESISESMRFKGVTVFLVFTGIALLLAWLPDIITALQAGRPLLLIETYTTEITYALDMGIIAPLCFICVYFLKRRQAIGYVLLDILLTLCIIIGVMLPVQTIFQMNAGIELPLPVLLTKVASFCLLAAFAVYFKIQLFRNINDTLKLIEPEITFRVSRNEDAILH